MRKSLSDFTFEELKGKSFEIISVIELLCEVCQKPLNERRKTIRRIKFSNMDELQNLLNKTKIYDRVEVDLEDGKIFFYSHDFPGDIHQECIEKL